MSGRTMKLGSALIALMCLGVNAGAEESGDTNWIDATLMDKNMQEHTITVRFDENEAIRTYSVGAQAELVRMGPNLNVPIDFEDMHVGADLRLEFDGLPGEETLRKVTEHPLVEK